MKKNIIIILGLSLVGLVGWMVIAGVKSIQVKQNASEIQNSLSGSMKALEVSNYKNEPTVLFFFNSECEHCQWEVKQVQEHISSLKKFQLFFVSFEPHDTARAFLNEYGLDHYLLHVPAEKLMTTFSGGVPQTFIYRNDLLVKHFKGEVKIEAVLELLEKQ